RHRGDGAFIGPAGIPTVSEYVSTSIGPDHPELRVVGNPLLDGALNQALHSVTVVGVNGSAEILEAGRQGLGLLTIKRPNVVVPIEGLIDRVPTPGGRSC